jgi:hypothetical protein
MRFWRQNRNSAGNLRFAGGGGNCFHKGQVLEMKRMLKIKQMETGFPNVISIAFKNNPIKAFVESVEI